VAGAPDGLGLAEAEPMTGAEPDPLLVGADAPAGAALDVQAPGGDRRDAHLTRLYAHNGPPSPSV